MAKWAPFRFFQIPHDPECRVVRMWDVATANEVAVFENCRRAYFSPDGGVLATVHEDKTVKLRKLPLRKPFRRILGWTLPLWLIAVLITRLLVKLRVEP